VHGLVAELVDAVDSKSTGLAHLGSTPSEATIDSSLARHWADRIADTGLSNLLRSEPWVIPVSQSIHIAGVAVVFASAVMIGVRLAGLNAAGRSLWQLVDTLVPWIYRAVLVLLLTGSVQLIAEPLRELVTPAFWYKQGLIIVALSLTIGLAHSVRAHAAGWDAVAQRPVIARLFALLWLGLWIGIIFCGRFIAYTWEFHV
jgi:hypothetical protein